MHITETGDGLSDAACDKDIESAVISGEDAAKSGESSDESTSEVSSNTILSSVALLQVDIQFDMISLRLFY